MPQTAVRFASRLPRPSLCPRARNSGLPGPTGGSVRWGFRHGNRKPARTSWTPITVSSGIASLGRHRNGTQSASLSSRPRPRNHETDAEATAGAVGLCVSEHRVGVLRHHSVYPALLSFNIAFRDWNTFKGAGPWVGLENYTAIWMTCGSPAVMSGPHSPIRLAMSSTGCRPRWCWPCRGPAAGIASGCSPPCSGWPTLPPT